MSKKTLKEKINDVAFWTIIFLIIYLIIGYLLESLWLSKSLKLDEFYDLLKDGFAITAAFLAPVAAFILFSDWRTTHKSIREENIVLGILENIKLNTPRMDVALSFIYAEHEHNSEVILCFEQQITDHRDNVLKRLGHIEYSQAGFECKEFHKKSKLLLGDQYELLTTARVLLGDVEMLKRLRIEPGDSAELDLTVRSYKYHVCDFIQRYEIYQKNAESRVLELERLAGKYVI